MRNREKSPWKQAFSRPPGLTGRRSSLTIPLLLGAVPATGSSGSCSLEVFDMETDGPTPRKLTRNGGADAGPSFSNPTV